MHSFLLCAGVRHEDPALLLDRAGGILARQLPSLGPPLERRVIPLPALHGGLILLTPAGEPPPGRISLLEEPDRLALVWGQLHEPAPHPAQRVAQVWRDEGVDGVRRLPGVFSCLLVERDAGRLWLAGDAIGRRSLRYWEMGGTLLASPHDLALVASGLVEPRWDPVSACSVVTFDWSLGGMSLLQGVVNCDAQRVVSWENGRLNDDRRPLWRVNEEPRERKRHAKERQAAMVERLHTLLAAMAGPAGPVSADLTAGRDSRALLAALVGALGPERITAQCWGGEGSREVRGAAEVAEKAGVAFERVDPTPNLPDPEVFAAHLALLACAGNGAINGKAALGPLPRLSWDAPPHFTGLCGEIHRGFFYKGGRPGGLARLDPERAMERVEAVCSRARGIATLLDPALYSETRLRLRGVGNDLARLCQRGDDLLDLFYLLERVAHWAVLETRPSWMRKLSPLGDPSLAALTMALPPPVGVAGGALLADLVARYIPQAAFGLIATDNEAAATAPRGGWFARLLGRRPPLDPGNHDALLGQWLARHMAELRPTLSDPAGLPVQLLGEAGLAKLLRHHETGRWDHTQVVGSLAMLESFRRQVEGVAQAARLAARNHRPA